jgi:hypothetical protein
MRRNLANSEIPIALMGQLQSCLKGSKAALSAETTAKAFTSLTCLHEDHGNGGQNSYIRKMRNALKCLKVS